MSKNPLKGLVTAAKPKSLDDLGAAKAPVATSFVEAPEVTRKVGRPPKAGRDKSNEVRQSFGLSPEIHEEFKIMMLRRKLAGQDVIAHLVTKLVSGDQYLLEIVDELHRDIK